MCLLTNALISVYILFFAFLVIDEVFQFHLVDWKRSVVETVYLSGGRMIDLEVHSLRELGASSFFYVGFGFAFRGCLLALGCI